MDSAVTPYDTLDGKCQRSALMVGQDLPALPLLLWNTPPGLELALSQEGVPFRKVNERSLESFAAGRFVLFDGRCVSTKTVRLTLSPQHVSIDVDLLRNAAQNEDPFVDLTDTQAVHKVWTIDGYPLTERVAKVDKAAVRHLLMSHLQALIIRAGGVWARIAPFPHPYRSAFNFRADLDEPFPEDYAAYARARRPIDDCSTHFVSTAAYGNSPAVLADLQGVDTQSHGHFHVIYRSTETNRRNLERAHHLLCDRGFAPQAFASPEGRWTPDIDRIMESLGYVYSSDFSLGYDDLPFTPCVDGRFSKVLQIPVHPICEGLFLNAGCTDPATIANYLISIVQTKVARGETAFVYGHPERRLGRFPQVIAALAAAVGDLDRVWRVTLTEFARWWIWRARQEWSLRIRSDGRYEIQFEDWDSAFPLTLEIIRGDHSATLPILEPRQTVDPSSFVFVKGVTPSIEPSPRVLRNPRGWKSAIRAALDWETVTPLEELPNDGLRNRLKLHLRKKRSSTLRMRGTSWR
jgi:hypothetical protein